MNYSIQVKQKLLYIIKKMDSYHWLFTKNPETDFSRKKKWSFEDVMRFMLTMEGKSLRDELLEYFEFDNTTPSNSSFNQRRAQILPEAFEFLFQEFTKSFTDNATYKGLRLIACDGTTMVYIALTDYYCYIKFFGLFIGTWVEAFTNVHSFQSYSLQKSLKFKT